MTTSITQSEKNVTFATYTITVESSLTPDELATNFNSLTDATNHISLSNVFGDTTTLEVFNVSLDKLEWIGDEEQ